MKNPLVDGVYNRYNITYYNYTTKYNNILARCLYIPWAFGYVVYTYCIFSISTGYSKCYFSIGTYYINSKEAYWFCWFVCTLYNYPAVYVSDV